MRVTLTDNISGPLTDVLLPAISSASRVRLAVAFAKMSGYGLLEPALRACIDQGGRVEFLFGLDFRTTEPTVLKTILDWREECERVALYCFSDPMTERARSYHPKLYIMQRPPATTTVIGSSNLTAGGLSDNAEANIVIKACEDEQVVSEILDTYHHLKLQPTRFAPDSEYVASYAEAYRRMRQAERSAQRRADVRRSVSATRRREKHLPKPAVAAGDFVGWQRLVLEKLPEREFSTGDIYRYADEFRRHYPQNQNVEPKIRQVLQQLRDLHVVAHVGPGRWRFTGRAVAVEGEGSACQKENA